MPLSPRSKSPDEPNTVYGELKLSEKLSLDMIQLRKEKDQMMERIEHLEIEVTNLEKKLQNTEISFKKNLH